MGPTVSLYSIVGINELSTVLHYGNLNLRRQFIIVLCCVRILYSECGYDTYVRMYVCWIFHYISVEFRLRSATGEQPVKINRVYVSEERLLSEVTDPHARALQQLFALQLSSVCVSPHQCCLYHLAASSSATCHDS